MLECARVQRTLTSIFYPHPHSAKRLVRSPLRASSDHRFIVGAREHRGLTSYFAIPFLSCAFREQEDDQATRSFLLCQVLKHISDTSCSALQKIRNVYVFAD